MLKLSHKYILKTNTKQRVKFSKLFKKNYINLILLCFIISYFSFVLIKSSVNYNLVPTSAPRPFIRYIPLHCNKVSLSKLKHKSLFLPNLQTLNSVTVKSCAVATTQSTSYNSYSQQNILCPQLTDFKPSSLNLKPFHIKLVNALQCSLLQNPEVLKAKNLNYAKLSTNPFISQTHFKAIALPKSQNLSLQPLQTYNLNRIVVAISEIKQDLTRQFLKTTEWIKIKPNKNLITVITNSLDINSELYVEAYELLTLFLSMFALNNFFTQICFIITNLDLCKFSQLIKTL